MDIIRFHNPTSATKMERGEIINGLKSKLWIERYDKAGEFKLVAPASSGMRELLPIDSFISHVDAHEIMIVENHEISDQKDKEDEIIITGRGYETFLDNRIVGSNKTFPTSGTIVEYALTAGYTWNQIVTLLSDHLLPAGLIDDNYQIPYLSISTDVAGTGVSEARTVKRGSLYSRMLELMEVDYLGIKIVRPGPWSPLAPGSPNVALVIHKGVDRSDQVVYSYDTGEIESADYLWSNKLFKNTAYVSGKWVETVVTTAATGYARRMMQVDASDIDNEYATAPAGGTLTTVVAKMQQRGLEALAAQHEIALTKAEVSKDTNQSSYRTDFNVGDIITVQANYNEASAMRISEYVEIEDENGRSGYPTLQMV